MAYHRHHHGHGSEQAADDFEAPHPGRRSLTEGLLQRKASGAPRGEGDADGAVAAAGSSGSVSLPDGLASRLSQAAGQDVSAVRVHTGKGSASAAAALSARAYTLGQDIHFGAGEYTPGTPAGDQLIAHEVAHTLQQGSGASGVQTKLAVSQPGDALEHEADAFATAFGAGQTLAVQGQGAGTVQRRARGTAEQQLQVVNATTEKRSDTASLSLSKLDDAFKDQKPATSQQGPDDKDVPVVVENVADVKLRPVVAEAAAQLADADKTVTVALDLTKFGGDVSSYRISFITANNAPKIVGHRIGTMQSMTTDDVDAAKKKFDAHKFTTTGTWSDADLGVLYEAIGLCPESMLSVVDGLGFSRQATLPASAPGGKAPGGRYQPTTHVVEMADLAMEAKAVVAGTHSENARQILHEISHAVDMAPLRKAAKFVDGASTADPGDAKSVSGTQWNSSLDELEGSTGAFQTALAQDTAAGSPKAITTYGAKSSLENFAECFSTYLTDPGLLEQVRPKVYKFFKDKYAADKRK
jgi:Mlc titration factor MtfA (ptsG expression regulator)